MKANTKIWLGTLMIVVPVVGVLLFMMGSLFVSFGWSAVWPTICVVVGIAYLFTAVLLIITSTDDNPK